MEFVSSCDKLEGCLFCCVAQDIADAQNWVLTRGHQSLLMLNAYPYTNGHLMVAPFRHTADLTSILPDEMADMMALVQTGMKALSAVYRPHGFNVGMNLGAAAGAGIADHLHIHIVPRWTGDTNFMPVVGDTRVLPESLDQSYARILAQLQALSAPDESADRPHDIP